VNQGDSKIRDQETTFIGKITASLSHEFMNALAIIRERSGLIEDLMALDQEEASPFRDKLAQTLTTIREQVMRGIAIGERLNQFAHSMDEPIARVKINDLLELITFLMQHFARRKKLQIKVAPVEPPLGIETDPFRLLLLLGACIEYCMDRTCDGGEITLLCQNTPHGTTIHCIVSRGALRAGDVDGYRPMKSRWEDVLKGLRARLDLLDPTDQNGVVVTLHPSQNVF
jgi:signal transduction histidine kinase